LEPFRPLHPHRGGCAQTYLSLAQAANARLQEANARLQRELEEERQAARLGGRRTEQEAELACHRLQACPPPPFLVLSGHAASLIPY